MLDRAALYGFLVYLSLSSFASRDYTLSPTQNALKIQEAAKQTIESYTVDPSIYEDNLFHFTPDQLKEECKKLDSINANKIREILTIEIRKLEEVNRNLTQMVNERNAYIRNLTSESIPTGFLKNETN